MTWKAPGDPYEYNEGFGNHFTAIAPGLPSDALPLRGHNPQRGPYGLYTEQLSGTAFTCPRHLNQRTWLYRIRPSVGHTPFVPVPHPYLLSSFTNLSDPNLHPTPTQLRWDPFEIDITKDETFVESLRTIAGAGETQGKNGLAIHRYGFVKGMEHQAFYNSDGDMLILPVLGILDVRTEFGRLWVPPGEILVVPRGVKFGVSVGWERGSPGGEGEVPTASGYVLETFSALHFALPDLGPIGANGLANPRDFKYPIPDYEDIEYPLTTATNSSSRPEVTTIPHFILLNKFLGRLYSSTQPHSAYDIPAYNGNYLPYKYPLSLFSPVGSISFDHPDPSIFTVLTVPNPATPGTALADFVVFSPRWLVAEQTFRPPYFHRNCMSEFMVNVMGEYDAKSAKTGGFVRGGASLHGMNVAHGPDKESYEKEVARGGEGTGDRPVKVGEGSLAIMFETSMQLVTTRWAVEECGKRQEGYWKCWEGFEVEWRKRKPQGA